eukprot:4408987-Pleurochrysis_carterae.AAC.1
MQKAARRFVTRASARDVPQLPAGTDARTAAAGALKGHQGHRQRRARRSVHARARRRQAGERAEFVRSHPTRRFRLLETRL